MTTTIQRYMDLPKFISLLQTNSLYLAKMSIFEDALEGGLTATDYLKTSNDLARLDLAINGLRPVANEAEHTRTHRLENAQRISKEISARKFETPFGSFLCDKADTVFPACREWLYVSCWHESEHECSAMWKLYGNDKNSLCLFSTLEKLKGSLSRKSSLNQLEIEPVNYIDHKSDILPSKPISPFIAKSKPYSFEKEIRLIAWNSEIDISINPKNEKTGIFIDIDLHTLIEKIIISPHADSWFKATVEKLCRDSGLNAEIQNSSIHMQPITDIYQAARWVTPLRG